MASSTAENPLIVTTTCLLAVAGVLLLRAGLGLNYQLWAGAYLAMGLTASVRRTPAGTDYSVGSALRGFACLAVGLFATYLLGYHGAWHLPPRLIPEGLAAALARAR